MDEVGLTGGQPQLELRRLRLGKVHRITCLKLARELAHPQCEVHARRR
jgi:hypothetical protein